MFDAILEGARRLSAEELGDLIGRLRGLVMEAMGAPEGEPESCPRCGGKQRVRRGFDRTYRGDGTVEAVQRHERGSCHRSCTRNTMGLLRLSRLGADVWSKFVEPALRGEPLSACAEECGVSKPTAHYMRLRPCQAMERAAPALSCGRGDGCRVDGKHLDESLAGLGMGSAKGGPQMPRDAHRTGGDVHGRGISNDKVCVICGVADETGVLFNGPAPHEGPQGLPLGAVRQASRTCPVTCACSRARVCRVALLPYRRRGVRSRRSSRSSVSRFPGM